MRTTYIFLWLILSAISSFAQEWKPATPPPDFYSDHTFGFAIDGKGYLVSGNAEFTGPTKTFLQFDPETDVWTQQEDFPGPGRGYGIGDVWERKAYFGFGSTPDSLMRDLWVFDADSLAWRQLASCPCEPRLHPAMVVNQGKLFVGLGNNNNGNLTDWWEYDIPTDSWTQKPDFPDVKRHHPYQFAIGDYVYTGLGHGNGIFREWYRYDPSLEEWQKMSDIPGEGRVAGTQFSFDGKGYVLSGDGDDHLSMETGEMWRYDPVLNAWDSLPPHPGTSRWAPASFVIDGVVYIYNGTTTTESGGNAYLSDAYSFDLKEPVSTEAEPSAIKQYSLYPNPFSSFLHIGSQGDEYDALFIYSLDNKLLYQGRYASQHDVSTLPSGLYHIDIRKNGKTESMLGLKQ